MSEESSPLLCRQVTYSGHVQGVGFRWTTRRIAASHAVVGYVQNEPDGTVTLLAQGERSDVEAFLADVAEVMSSQITRMETSEVAIRDDLAGFRIRR